MNLIPTREKYTTSISSRLSKEDPNYNKYRFFFFELDNPYTIKEYYRICELYRLFGVDFLCHRSGNGLHFISPTLITLEIWTEMMAYVKDINPRCPQLNLRWKGNKYVNEKEIWFNSCNRVYNDGSKPNSYELVNLLNSLFHTEFKGNYPTVLKFNDYKQKYGTK